MTPEEIMQLRTLLAKAINDQRLEIDLAGEIYTSADLYLISVFGDSPIRIGIA